MVLRRYTVYSLVDDVAHYRFARVDSSRNNGQLTWNWSVRGIWSPASANCPSAIRFPSAAGSIAPSLLATVILKVLVHKKYVSPLGPLNAWESGEIAIFKSSKWFYLQRCCDSGCKSLWWLYTGRQASSSSRLRRERPWPGTGWRCWRPHGNRPSGNCNYYSATKTHWVCKQLQSLNQNFNIYLRSWPLSSEETSSMWTWSHSCWI